jgi:hypothetical protein
MATASMQAISAIAGRSDVKLVGLKTNETVAEWIARESYAQADAMLAERGKA